MGMIEACYAHHVEVEFWWLKTVVSITTKFIESTLTFNSIGWKFTAIVISRRWQATSLENKTKNSGRYFGWSEEYGVTITKLNHLNEFHKNLKRLACIVHNLPPNNQGAWWIGKAAKLGQVTIDDKAYEQVYFIENNRFVEIPVFTVMLSNNTYERSKNNCSVQAVRDLKALISCLINLSIFRSWFTSSFDQRNSCFGNLHTI